MSISEKSYKVTEKSVGSTENSFQGKVAYASAKIKDPSVNNPAVKEPSYGQTADKAMDIR